MRNRKIKKMKAMTWYHKMHLGDGIITPGYDFGELWLPLEKEIREVDFSKKKVLDIGCWDGKWSFEAEKLGATKIIATDIHSQRSFGKQGRSTFKFAKKHLNSKVKYREASVYELDRLFDNTFDIVMFFGVLYHLRYPQLGIANIRNVLKPGGLLLMETAVVLNTDDTIIQTDYNKIYAKDRSSWNAFSLPALCSLLEESYFSVKKCKPILLQGDGQKIGRAFVLGEAFSGKNVHHYFPDTFLKKYFKPLD